MSRLLHWLAGWITHGEILLWTPDGRRRRHGGARPGPTVRVRVHDPALAGRLVRGGAAALGAAWVDGAWDADDLVATLKILSSATDVRMRTAFGQRIQAVTADVTTRARDLVTGNTAVATMTDHYDLGNDFYAAWLDDTMSYSSGLVATDLVPAPATRDDVGLSVLAPPRRPLSGNALADAQRAKYDRILDQARLDPGDHLLEIGFGWGGLAMAAAGRGIRVTGVTISQEQLSFARRCVQQAGLADLVDLHLADFAEVADIVGSAAVDAIATVEMIESIPQQRWDELFAVTSKAVRPGGRIVHQAIVIADDLFATYAERDDFITTWIFPDGRLPAPGVLADLASRHGLLVDDVVAFGATYAATLATWWRRFDDVFTDRIAGLGFDERFRRMWHYYLAYCQAGFEVGRIDVGQWTLQVPA